MATQRGDTGRNTTTRSRPDRASPHAAAKSARALEGQGADAFNKAAEKIVDDLDKRPEPPSAPDRPAQPTQTMDAELDRHWRDVGELLRAPFAPTDIEWRLQQVGLRQDKTPWGKAIAYVTARAIMDRLDGAVGPSGWRDYYQHGPEGGVMCGIGIRIAGEWVYKWDGAGNPTASGGLSEADSVKGGYSNAFKRAAVKWGIGRYLYDLEEGWVIVVPDRAYGHHNAKEKKVGKTTIVIPAFHWNPPPLPPWALPIDGDERETPRPLSSSARPIGAPSASSSSTTPSKRPPAGAPPGASTASSDAAITTPTHTPTTSRSSATKATTTDAPNAEPGSVYALTREITDVLGQLDKAKHAQAADLRKRAEIKIKRFPNDHDKLTEIRDALRHLYAQHLGDAGDDQEGDTARIVAQPSTNSANASAPPSAPAAAAAPPSPATTDASAASSADAKITTKMNLDAVPMIDHAGSLITPACPVCSTMMVDQRATKKNKRAPDFVCDRRSCEGKYWPNEFQTHIADGRLEGKIAYGMPRGGREWSSAEIRKTKSGFPVLV